MPSHSDELLHKPHHSVTLVVAADHLKPGEFEVQGHFYPEGQLGAREPKYNYVITSRDAYNAKAKSFRRRFGNTIAGAEAFFKAMQPK